MKTLSMQTLKTVLGAIFFLFIVLPMMMVTLFIMKHFMKTDIRNL